MAECYQSCHSSVPPLQLRRCRYNAQDAVLLEPVCRELPKFMHLSKWTANLSALTWRPQMSHLGIIFGSFGGIRPQISAPTGCCSCCCCVPFIASPAMSPTPAPAPVPSDARVLLRDRLDCGPCSLSSSTGTKDDDLVRDLLAPCAEEVEVVDRVVGPISWDSGRTPVLAIRCVSKATSIAMDVIKSLQISSATAASTVIGPWLQLRLVSSLVPVVALLSSASSFASTTIFSRESDIRRCQVCIQRPCLQLRRYSMQAMPFATLQATSKTMLGAHAWPGRKRETWSKGPGYHHLIHENEAHACHACTQLCTRIHAWHTVTHC